MYTEKALIDLKAQIDPNTVIVADLNTSLLSIDMSPSKRSTRNYRYTLNIRPNRHGIYLQSISLNS
jgi:hypothetical protein